MDGGFNMTKRMTQKQLEAIRNRAETATEGPYDEEWRSINGTNGNYEVSNRGNVRSRLKPGNHRNKIGNPRNLKQNENEAGYYTISLPIGKDGQYITKTVHSLIAESFFGKRPDGFETAHLNGDSRDNRVENLKYVTPKENESHKREHGTIPLGERNGQSKLLGWQVEIIKYLASKGIPQSHVARLFDISYKTVSPIVNGERWGHVQSHKDIPALLAEVDALRAENSRLCPVGDLSTIETLRTDIAYRDAEIERLRGNLNEVEALLSEAQSVLDGVHCYETDAYLAIERYFNGGRDD